MAILQTKKLKKVYGGAASQVVAINEIDFEANKGEFVAITGTSGSGKSTLLHLLGGLDSPTSGEVIIDGTNIYELNDYERTIFRRQKIGFVFQSYNLIPT